MLIKLLRIKRSYKTFALVTLSILLLVYIFYASICWSCIFENENEFEEEIEIEFENEFEQFERLEQAEK